MSKPYCDIQSRAVARTTYPHFTDEVPSTLKSQCITHGWDMTGTQHLKGNDLCPIGKIEAATDHALNLIQDKLQTGK